jgi:hypothetical protein
VSGAIFVFAANADVNGPTNLALVYQVIRSSTFSAHTNGLEQPLLAKFRVAVHNGGHETIHFAAVQALEVYKNVVARQQTDVSAPAAHEMSQRRQHVSHPRCKLWSTWQRMIMVLHAKVIQKNRLIGRGMARGRSLALHILKTFASCIDIDSEEQCSHVIRHCA